MRAFGYTVLCIVGIVVAVFGGNYLAFQNDAFFMPKREALRRDTMIESRAYQEATYRELANYRLQYTQAKTDDERKAIKGMAQHSADALDKSRLPIDLQVWLKSLGI